MDHTKECLAESMICVIENLRDDYYVSYVDFVIALQDGSARQLAFSYLNDGSGTKTCICPPKEN